MTVEGAYAVGQSRQTRTRSLVTATLSGMAKPDEYAAALDTLEQRRRSGAISEGEYQVWRQRLTSEMQAEVPTWRKVQRGMVWAGALILIALVLVAIFYRL